MINKLIKGGLMLTNNDNTENKNHMFDGSKDIPYAKTEVKTDVTEDKIPEKKFTLYKFVISEYTGDKFDLPFEFNNDKLNIYLFGYIDAFNHKNFFVKKNKKNVNYKDSLNEIGKSLNKIYKNGNKNLEIILVHYDDGNNS